MSYEAIAGAEPNEQILAGLTHALRPGEHPLVGARSGQFQFGLDKVQMATLLVTDQRLLVGKNKLFGKLKPVVTVELKDMASTGFGPLYGVGPTWEVHFHTVNQQPGIMYFDGPAQAEAFKNGLHHAAVAGVPAPAEVSPPAALDDDDGRLSRLHDLIDDLRPMATPEMLGVPFGEGHGLEQAMEAMFRRLQSPEDSRRCGYTVAVDIVTNATEGVAEDMANVMGSTEDAALRHQLSTEGRAAVRSIGGAADELLGQLDGPGSMWDLWGERGDVAGEMLCWHTVARLRLATAGRMPPVTRP
jgi:hypothetical protein